MSRFERYFRLAKKTHMPVILADIEGDEDMVLMPLDEYERLLDVEEDYASGGEYYPEDDEEESEEFDEEYDESEEDEHECKHCHDLGIRIDKNGEIQADDFEVEEIAPVEEFEETDFLPDTEELPFEVPEETFHESKEAEMSEDDVLGEPEMEITSEMSHSEEKKEFSPPKQPVGKWASVGSVFHGDFEPGRALGEKIRHYEEGKFEYYPKRPEYPKKEKKQQDDFVYDPRMQEPAEGIPYRKLDEELSVGNEKKLDEEMGPVFYEEPV
ncbi:MAG: hypothetical protein V1848_00505 [Candidatus Magasanikbacteria bacterium]